LVEGRITGTCIQQSIRRSSIHPGIHVSVVAGRGASETKTHDRCQPWVFVKLLRSTSANGIAGYDDYQNDSLRGAYQHCGGNVNQICDAVKPFFG
jgi:hypothetical protein